MEWIQRLLESGTTPIVTAFLLGLLTAISPCPLATNIAAVGFIGKDIDDKHRVFCNGLLYTAGRILTYAGIGLAFIPLLREGANTYALQKIIGKYGDAIVAPALILIGLFMLFGHRLNLPKFGFSGHCEKIGRHGSWGALLLGILFSLAFCPSSGVFYFGMLIPMAAAEPGGWFLPVVFAIATGMPVVIAAWILAYGAAGVGIFYGRMQIIRKWLARTVGMLFIAVGIYYWIIYFFRKNRSSMQYNRPLWPYRHKGRPDRVLPEPQRVRPRWPMPPAASFHRWRQPAAQGRRPSSPEHGF